MTSVHHGFGIKNLIQNNVAGQKFGSKIRVKNYAEKEPIRAVARALQALFFISSAGDPKEVATYP